MPHRPPTYYAWLSVFTSLVTIGLKFGAWWITGSVGLLSDAIEGFVNIAAALVALAVLTYAAQAPDREHNFGHDKAQYFSSGIEGALIFVAAVAIIWSAVPRLFDPHPIEQIGMGIVLSIFATIANAWCAWIMLRAARAHRSITLEADARHLLTDVWTTLGVVLGVGLAALTGWNILDPLIAIGVALQIVWTGWELVHRSFHGLMDRSIPDDELAIVHEILDRVCKQGGDFHNLRTRQAGAKHYIDVHVLIPGAMSLQAAHDLSENLEAEIHARLPHAEVLVHLEPIEDPRSWDDPAKPKN